MQLQVNMHTYKFLTRWQHSSYFDLVCSQQLNTKGGCIYLATESFMFGQFYSIDLINDDYSSDLRTKKVCHPKIIKVHPGLSTLLSRFCGRPFSPLSLKSHSELMTTPVIYPTAHINNCITQLEYI